MNLRVLILCLIGSVPVFSSTQLQDDEVIEGYYWRDYRGFIPDDAYAGGNDDKNQSTYIGQVLFNNLLVPGEIRENEHRAYYEWGFQEFSATENVKILCSMRPDLFRWIPTTKDTFKLLDSRNFVPGGFEPDQEIFIGRKRINKANVIGKVQGHEVLRDGVFHYPANRQGHFDYNYEVLIYNKSDLITISFYF